MGNKIINNIFSKIGLLCFFAILLFSANKADANVDSLRQIWMNAAQPDSIRFNAINDYYNKNIYTQPDSVILLTTYHIELAKQKHLKKERAIAFNNKAIAYTLKGDYDQAIIEINKTVDIYANLNDSIGLVKTYNNLANIYTYKIDYQEALKYFSKCLIFCQTNEMKNFHAAVLMNIGLVHLDIENYDLALEYFNKSLHLYQKFEMEQVLEVGHIWLNIGLANLGKKNYQQAIKNSQKALKIFQSSNTQYSIAFCYTLNATTYQELNQIDSALVYIKKGLKIHQKIGADLKILEDKIILANLIANKNLRKATKIGEEVLKTADQYDNHSMKIDLFNLLYKCYKKQGNYPLSIAMLEKYNNYSDSLRIEQNHIALAKNAIQSEYESKILNEQLKHEQSQSKLKLSQLIKTYSICFIGVLLMLFIAFNARAKRIILSKEKEGLVNKIDHLKELENTRNQLIQSDKMASLGQLTAGVAHEINNPVNFISSGVIGLKKTLDQYIKTPKEKVTDELVKDMNDMIDAIEEGANRTSNIVKSLRLFSREDTENYIEADLIKGLESTLTLLSNKKEEGIFLEKDFEKREMPIFCFPGQLNQVFMNILLNAIQAVNGAGTIKVGVKEAAENIVISISDNGLGIPDDKKQKIFEPFYTTKDVQEGTGLGLSISFGIIKKHKGSIEVIDNDPKETTFIISLPKRADGLISSI